MYSKRVTIHDGRNFEVVSYGNGAAYLFLNKDAGLSVFLQGDDAERFREEYEDVDVCGDVWTLQELWNQYDDIAEEA
jgi:hypothetical protein